MPPLFFTSVRQIIAGLLILGFLFFLRNEPFPGKDYLFHQMVLGFLLITCGNGVGIYGLQYIDSGISAILATFSPILMAFLVSISKSEYRIQKWTWLGLSLGSVGIIIICIQNIGMHPGGTTVMGILFTLLSVLAWSLGSVHSKLNPQKNSPFLSAGFQMLFGGLPVLLTSLVIEKPWNFVIETNHILIWLYTIVFGSLVAYSCFIYALKHLPVTLVSIHNYINPILAIFLGAVILHEAITLWILLGASVTLVGVYIVTRHG